jgi:hypothetical protein
MGTTLAFILAFLDTLPYCLIVLQIHLNQPHFLKPLIRAY